MRELANVALRALTLASKFVLLVFLARVLSPAKLGVYGLVAATVAYGVVALGLDFYTYANRELLRRERNQWPALIRDQAALYAAAYVALLPAFALLFKLGLLPWTVAIWFFLLLVLEHLAQELNRVLIALGRPLMANAVLFVRNGMWVWVVLPLMLLEPKTRNLDAVFAAWATGAAGAVVAGSLALRDLPWTRCEWRVNWRWIRAGVGTAALFLVATLSFRGLFTLDRYIVQAAAGRDLLGVYTLYIGIALALTAFLDAGVFAFTYPRAVATYNAGNLQKFLLEMKRMRRHTIFALLALITGAAVLIKPVVMLLDRPIYAQHTAAFWLLLVAVALYGLGMVPHYGLYALGRDRVIAASHASGLLVFVAVALTTTEFWSLESVPLALVAAFSLILLVKSWRYRYWLLRVARKPHLTHTGAGLEDEWTG